MTVIMIAHIKSKYTSVGRKEIVQFFYSYLICILSELLLVTNIIPFSSSAYKVFIKYYVLVLHSDKLWRYSKHIYNSTAEQLRGVPVD